MDHTDDIGHRIEPLGPGTSEGTSSELTQTLAPDDIQQTCPGCRRTLPMTARYCVGCGVSLPDVPIIAAAQPATPEVRGVSLTTGKTRAVRVFMLLTGGLSLATAAAHIFEVTRFNTWWNASVEEEFATSTALSSAEGISAVAILLLVVAQLTLFVLLIVWMYAASKDVQRLDVKNRRWQPAWAIWGWFLPLAGGGILFGANLLVSLPLWLVAIAVLGLVIASYYIIRSVLNEIDRASGANSVQLHNGLWRGLDIVAEGRVWWVGLVVGGLLANAGYRGWNEQIEAGVAFDNTAYATSLWLIVVGSALVGVASFAGSRYIAKLGVRFR